MDRSIVIKHDNLAIINLKLNEPTILNLALLPERDLENAIEPTTKENSTLIALKYSSPSMLAVSIYSILIILGIVLFCLGIWLF